MKYKIGQKLRVTTSTNPDFPKGAIVQIQDRTSEVQDHPMYWGVSPSTYAAAQENPGTWLWEDELTPTRS